VNAWLLRARWWQFAALSAALLAPVFVLLQRFLGHERWVPAAIVGSVTAAVCGPILALMLTGRWRDMMAAAGPLAEEDRASVERAARRGPVPADPQLREAARRLAEDRLLTLRRTRTRALVTMSVFVVLTAASAVLRSPWWWIAVGVCVGMLAVGLTVPARVERRAALLRGEEGLRLAVLVWVGQRRLARLPVAGAMIFFAWTARLREL
jgi:hypothetical protein